jgi:hypothetical protein
MVGAADHGLQWEMAPKYLVRDNDRAFGAAFKVPRPGDGHPGPADVLPFALAERPC